MDLKHSDFKQKVGDLLTFDAEKDLMQRQWITALTKKNLRHSWRFF